MTDSIGADNKTPQNPSTNPIAIGTTIEAQTGTFAVRFMM
jgi:hypothetical protein